MRIAEMECTKCGGLFKSNEVGRRSDNNAPNNCPYCGAYLSVYSKVIGYESFSCLDYKKEKFCWYKPSTWA
jgi:NAD-dependent SIR2 family protein deacetylase